jgi:uncharacterized protein (TIGR02996 family)
MSDDLSFIRALLAKPDDDPPRLVYADWLEESADPRGTFLRLEVALRRAETKARARDLRERLHQARRGLDARWLALVDRPQAGWRIVRPGPPKIYGKAIPAFIHNGDFFLSAINVYADGAIECWGFVDLPLFRRKLAEGWVVPGAEVGGKIVMHNSGSARVTAAQWDLTPGDLGQKVEHTLRELNPTMEGLLDMQGTDVEVRNGIRYAKGSGWGKANPYRITLAGDDVAGAQLTVFEVTADGYRLRPWLIYADGLSQLGSGSELLPLEAVARMLEAGQLTLSVPEGARVALDGLGRFQAGQGYGFIEPGELLREASDLLDQLKGGPGAIDCCVRALVAYESDPSRANREALRVAYEAVPEHLRMFCGDMDSKDWPIRRILFDSQDETPPQ